MENQIIPLITEHGLVVGLVALGAYIILKGRVSITYPREDKDKDRDK